MKSFSPLLLLAFTLLSSALPARAAPRDPVAEQFRARARLVPQYLYDRGYRQFGRLDLSQMLSNINGASIDSAPTVVTRSDGSEFLITERCLARWDSQGGLKVTVGRDCFRRASERELLVVGMHEFTGPAGINDEKYGPSSLLYLLYRAEQTGALSEAERADLVTRIELASNGGITAVGGGGDGAGVRGRIDLMERGLARVGQAAAGSEDRARALTFLYGSSTYTNEERRSGTCSRQTQWQSYPSELALAVTCMNTIEQYRCQAMDKQGRVNQRKFRTLMDGLVRVMQQKPELKAVFPDTDSFLARCEKEMQGLR